MDMDNLPPPLILEILSRLADSTDLARCRVASKTLNALSRDVRSINLYCSSDRYTKSRSPETRDSITPFKRIFNKLISELSIVEAVSIGVDKPFGKVSYGDATPFGIANDLYLTDVNFVAHWLPKVNQNLRALSISDLWVQSRWQRSNVLALISSYCPHLLELEIKNSWLSVDGLLLMPKLTTLTLEFITLYDENLDKVNQCFPYLQVLNLIGVEGLKEPKIHLEHLKHCHWTVSSGPRYLTIVAPKLVQLNLRCVKPKMLVIDTPSLSYLHLTLQGARSLKVQEFHNLDTLHLVSPDLGNLLCSFQFGRTVNNLVLGAKNRTELLGQITFCFEMLFVEFPNVKSITVAPQVWAAFQWNFSVGDLELEVRTYPKGLKEITAYLMMLNVDMTLKFISHIVNSCTSLCDMALFIPRGLRSNDASDFITKCTAQCSKVRLRWGTWKEGTKDAWIIDGV
ncbi:F-box/LRR-repeat protein At4g29420 [Nicotiana tabacum]|uniref:F-box/LRR-repeat protein At4g29420 n=1 Tax=Nicotiana tabacum TaxID=4097 RepID=A0A1S4A0S3_TOBAC|nr:F-box/LRR-repeat protein At4g29420 [Nicotiana tomentosiformis]XP_016470238.1 PREDICTED: F-box/LRR-repeat protein At4g29420 [Nicotiana tabacum]